MGVARFGRRHHAVGVDLGDLLVVGREAAEAGDVFARAVGPDGDGLEVDLSRPAG